jgi:diadenosine tetraphosphate (Ap4A) HIT family hydrolase
MRSLFQYLAPLLGWVFAHMSFVIPVKRLRETDTLMAFYHPKPSYPFHVLLLPKKAAPSLQEFDPTDTTFLTDLY